MNGLTDEMKDFINDLLNRAEEARHKSEDQKNCTLSYVIKDSQFDMDCPIRVDDFKLLFIGGALLPNIINYLVNIVPQFLYPYVVAYCQDLSNMREDPVTINELFDYIYNYYYGNILDGTETEN